jgi:hypothetical protein
MTQILLILEFELGMTPKHTACATSMTHAKAVERVSGFLRQMADGDEISPADADHVIKQIKKKNYYFTAYVLQKSGIVKGFAWGNSPVLSSENAKRLLNGDCNFSLAPTAKIEGTHARKER